MNEWMNAKANWIINYDSFSLAVESDKHSAGVYSIFNQNVKMVFHMSVI